MLITSKTALHWKNIKAPSIGNWLKEMAISISMEKVSYIVKGKYGRFEKVWNPLLFFLEREGNDVPMSD